MSKTSSFYEWTLPLLVTVKHLVESVNAWKAICKGNKSADLFPLQIAFQALTDSMFNCNQ